jgi:hypothetical protein
VKEVHEQVGMIWGHAGAHVSFHDLKVMLGVEGEVVVDEDELEI